MIVPDSSGADFGWGGNASSGDIDFAAGGGRGGGQSPVAGYGGAVFSVAGGILGAIGAQQAGDAQAAAYQANAGVAGTTAANARLSLNRAQQQSDYLANRLVGRQRAGYAAGGVGAASGSPLDVLGDTEEQIKVEAMNRFYAGEAAAKTASDQASFDATAARRAHQAADIGSFSAILSGVGQGVSQLARFGAL